jgi:hypothetical protein
MSGQREHYFRMIGSSANEATGRRTTHGAEQRDEGAPFLVELHTIPHDERGAAPQDIELAAISQRVVCQAPTLSANSRRGGCLAERND